MNKTWKMILWIPALCLLVCLGMLIADKVTLSRDLIRLHIVAASDSEADQAVKLLVRDAILAQAQALLVEAEDARQARSILDAHLTELERAANETLLAQGSSHRATVTLEQEAFPVRHYDSFSLPSGVYHSLRVRIGEAEGKNWWCVVFPALCIGAASEDTEAVSAASGFSESLSGALTGEKTYRFSFFFLDCIGKIENFFFS